MKWFIVALALSGCGHERTIEEDITICRGICGARPIDDFSSGSDWRNLSCRCGKIDPPQTPCPEAGAPKPRIDPW